MATNGASIYAHGNSFLSGRLRRISCLSCPTCDRCDIRRQTCPGRKVAASPWYRSRLTSHSEACDNSCPVAFFRFIVE